MGIGNVRLDFIQGACTESVGQVQGTTTDPSHKNYIWDSSGLFSIISHMSLSMMQFWSLPSIILLMSFRLHYKKNITRRLEDMNFIFLWQKQNFTHSLRLFVKLLFCPLKIKVISSHHRVISSIYYLNNNSITGYYSWFWGEIRLI